MPEFPEKPSQSKSTATSVTFNPNIPRVQSINGFLLLKENWEKKGGVYEKNGNTLKFDGTNWILNETTKVWFIEDVKTKNSDTRPE